MSELTFEQMLDESFKTIHNGEVVDGTVIDVKPDEIILNIGYKADGFITRSEYTNDNSVDLTTVVSVGDPMTVKVLKVNDGEGQVLLTYKRLVAEESAKGSYIVIIGNGEHPEVEGIRGWAGEQVTVIQTPEDAERFELPEKEQKVCIVAQTTFNYNKFKELVEIISKKRYDIVVLNTICNATKERQTEARQIAARVDAMVVIGDKRSSNTQKLFEICKEECLNTYYIQTLDDLDINQLRSVESVGITAGASTPNKIIEEVQNNVRINF